MNNSSNYDVKAIISLVLGVMARKENPSGIATAGLVTSWIGVILCAIVFVACVACVGCFSLAAAFSY